MRKKFIERNAPAGWNVRVFTDEDFWTFCDAAKIVVQFVQMERLGFYTKLDDKPVIYIHERLPAAERLYTQFHELGHYFLHPPGIHFFRCWEDAVEKEADVFAACAMIPRSLLNHYWDSEIAELYGYPADLIEFRRTIFDLWKL